MGIQNQKSQYLPLSHAKQPDFYNNFAAIIWPVLRNFLALSLGLSGLCPQGAFGAHVNEVSLYKAPNSLEEMDLKPWPTLGDKLFPSPKNWTDHAVYSVMLDRFSNGDRTNDCLNLDELEGQPKDLFHGCQGLNPFHFHGGDLKGLLNRIDYIAGMGFTSILLTPVTKTYGEYHGYSPYNFFDVESNFGTMEDMRAVVAAAHAKGIYIILDFVINHTAPVWQYDAANPYEPPFSCRVFDEDSRIPVKGWTGNALVPAELNDFSLFSRCGRIGNFDAPFESENGDFLVYKDLATWKPEVADMFVKIFSYWIAKADVDGFRLDALKHVDRRFLAKLMPGVRKFAASVGKKNVYFVGEAVATDHNYLNSWLGKNFSVDGAPTGEYIGVDGVYDTAAYYSAIASLKYIGTPLYNIESVAWVDSTAYKVFGSHAYLNLKYLDVLDTRRYLDYFDISKKYLRMALPWVFTSVGMPLLTYGTEQDLYEVKKVEDPDTQEIVWNVDWLDPGLGTRGDMVEEGVFRDPMNTDEQDLFREDYGTYNYIKLLNSLRHKFASLRRGLYFPRYYEIIGTGIYAYSRVYEDDEVIVVINNATEPKEANFSGSPTLFDRVWVDALDPSFEVTSGSEMGIETFSFHMEPITTRLLVKKSLYYKTPD